MRHDDETTHALLESAHRVLVSEGPEALTVRRIATDAGMSTMNVYSRFGGKDGILQSLFVSGHHKLSGMLAAVVAQSDPLDELRERATTYRDFALENPAYYAVMFKRAVPEFEASDESTAVALATLDHFAVCVGRLMESGDLPHGDPIATAAVLWAAAHGLVTLELDGLGRERLDWTTIFHSAFEATIRGLELHPIGASFAR